MSEINPVSASWPRVALVVGASGGIGYALSCRLLEEEALETLVLSSRRPPEACPRLNALQQRFPGRVHCLSADATDEDSLAALAKACGSRFGRLDLAIYAAGLLHDAAAGIEPERRLESVSPEALHRVFAVNTFGPLLLAKHLMPWMRHGDRAVFAALSARVGSLDDNRLGGWYAYRASKAALNMMLRNLAIEGARKSAAFIALGLHPGTVASPLSAPFQARVPAAQLKRPEQSAAALYTQICAATPAQSGRVLDYAGLEIPA